MQSTTVLWLGSTSYSRQLLLRQAGIPYILLSHDTDESACGAHGTLEEHVLTIARSKMEHVVLPHGTAGQRAYVLTADTLSQDDTAGAIHGKPLTEENARRMLQAVRAGVVTGTGFCIKMLQWQHNEWQVCEQVEGYAQAHYIFNVPDGWIDTYLAHSLALNASGAITIEEFGTQFLEQVNGSYSAIVGLPMYEVRCALEKLGFFK